MVEFLRALHDSISRIGFLVAAFALAFMVIAYCFEIFSRYVLQAPTVWVSPIVSYILCLMIFLSVPELTKQSSHIYIDYLESRLSPAAAMRVARIIRWIAATACFVAAWFTVSDAFESFESEILTNTYLPIPKWWLSILIPYAFFSSAIYFLRQAFREEGVAPGTGPAV
jgi:C4-dicarboxylate transporter, DctQ subunit